MAKVELLERLENKTAIIGVVGLGYVGLPLMLRYVEAGYPALVLMWTQPRLRTFRTVGATSNTYLRLVLPLRNYVQQLTLRARRRLTH